MTPGASSSPPRSLRGPARLAVFASGRGSNLAALMAAFAPGNPLGAVVLVLSDRADAPALAQARAAGTEALHLPWNARAVSASGVGTGVKAGSAAGFTAGSAAGSEGGSERGFEAAALEALERARIDYVLLAGFMRLLSGGFVRAYEGRILNIHPSLLPAFPGLHAVRRALAAGVRETGCTVHLVDEGVDSGPILLQRRVPVLPGDSEERLAARVLLEEHRAYPEAVRRVLAARLERCEAP